MRPWLVFGKYEGRIAPASWVGSVQVDPPFVDETYPTSSAHVDELQFALG